MAQILKCSLLFTGPLTQAKWHQLWWKSCPAENRVKTGERLQAVDLLTDYAQNWSDEWVFIIKLIKKMSGDYYCSLFFNITISALCHMTELWSHLGFWIKSLNSMCRLLSTSDSEMSLFPWGPGEVSFMISKGLADLYLHCTRTALCTVAVTAQEELRTGIREVIQVSVARVCNESYVQT